MTSKVYHPKRPKPPDETDIKIGLLTALGWKPSKIGEEIGMSYEGVHQRMIGSKAAFIAQMTEWTRAYVAREVAARVASIDLKQKINRKAYKTINKTLDHALDENTEEVSSTHIMAAKEGLDRTEGKALDRKAILSQHTENLNVTVHHVDGDALDSIAEEARRINEMRRKALTAPADVMEATLVESSTAAN